MPMKNQKKRREPGKNCHVRNVKERTGRQPNELASMTEGEISLVPRLFPRGEPWNEVKSPVPKS